MATKKTSKKLKKAKKLQSTKTLTTRAQYSSGGGTGAGKISAH